VTTDPATQITELAREAENLRRQLRDCEASRMRWIARAQEAEALLREAGRAPDIP